MNFLKRLFGGSAEETATNKTESKAIVDQFLKGLKERLSEEDNLSMSYATGAAEDQLKRLKKHFPGMPYSLLYLLQQIDGTYWRKYGEHTVCVLILGSDVLEYPYYLKSVDQILEENNRTESIRDIYDDYIEEAPELVGAGIDSDVKINRWLCFSDCMNNGGTSSLYIDFNPTPQGHYGQVVRFLHDPDSFEVIARNFDEYLQMLIKKDYEFVIKDE